jgi:methylated-DNA-[protein]-cysteine S-methyltransferase
MNNGNSGLKVNFGTGVKSMEKHSHFDEQCYELLQQIPKGKITTYGEIARALNSRAWRAVGSAMAKNQNLFVIPCHRVVRSDGSIGQYALGSDKKAELLQNEGIEVSNGRVMDMEKYFYRF